MIRINQVKVKPGHSEEELLKKISKALHTRQENITSYTIVKKSIDARKKSDICYSYALDVQIKNEKSVLSKNQNSGILSSNTIKYRFPKGAAKTLSQRPIIIGSGPAGLFCAYYLAMHGYKPIVFERGEAVEKRMKSVQAFWEGKPLNTESNVQFGEGGAGTFSDGKLNTLIKDKDGRNKEVLRTFVKAGAPKDILYEQKPHLGTDILISIVRNMRNTIIAHGGDVHFESKVTKILHENGCIKGVVINDKDTYESDVVVLAIGHSARDTFFMLHDEKIPMEAKPFAVGLRVEHKQETINKSQYGDEYDKVHLPNAVYKVAAKAKNGRSVYSFCMCPGGYVVNASSEEGRLAINGMSYSDRNSQCANSAIIVSVTPEDFPDKSPLGGIYFQRQLEENAFRAGNGLIPLQLYKDFKENKKSTAFGSYETCMKGGYEFANLNEVLPQSLNEAFIDGMEQFSRIVSGFANDDTILSAVESRTSSPVKICRDDTMQSTLIGLYPCGEGAGYAGGITSAAMDGIKIAEKIAKTCAPL